MKSKTETKRVADLEGAELDYWVAVAIGADKNDRLMNCLRARQWSPSTGWLLGGPIIEREQIGLVPCVGGHWAAEYGVGEDDVREMRGPTLLIAAMRAFVASKFGETVEVAA